MIDIFPGLARRKRSLHFIFHDNPYDSSLLLLLLNVWILTCLQTIHRTSCNVKLPRILMTCEYRMFNFVCICYDQLT
jgi:hypothetical protein